MLQKIVHTYLLGFQDLNVWLIFEARVLTCSTIALCGIIANTLKS